MNTPLDHSPHDPLDQQHEGCRERGALHNLGLTHSTTGFSALDRLLPGGGWPLSALTEIHHAQTSIGELRLLMPTLARLSRQGRWVAIIAPPYIPYAPALAAFGLDLSRVLLVHPKSQKDGLAALEQGLRSGTCGAVIAWPRQVDADAMQRLQAAAKAGKTWGILFRDPVSQEEPSSAAVRLRLEERDGNTVVHVLGKRNTDSGNALTLDLSRHASLLPKPAPKAAASPAPRRSEATRSRQQARFPARPHFKPNRRQELPPQLELPLPLPTDRQPPLRQDKPGILTWRWRR
jgi:hypothetical protein